METEISNWLKKSGYPLELYVASELQKRGYLCGKSEIFVDIETDKTREIDVTGYHYGEFESNNYSSSRRIIIECKKSDKPIINLCAGNIKKSRFYYQAIFGDPEDAARPDVLAYSRFEKNPNDIGAFIEEVPVGYSLLPAFGKSDQDIYSGLMGLIKASTYYRRLFLEFRNSSLNDMSLHLQDRNSFEFHTAVLVVDSPLFDVSLDDTGELEVVRSDWSVLKMQLPWDFNPHDSNEGYCIHIVTKPAFPLFLESIEKLHKYLYQEDNVDYLLVKDSQK